MYVYTSISGIWKFTFITLLQVTRWVKFGISAFLFIDVEYILKCLVAIALLLWITWLYLFRYFFISMGLFFFFLWNNSLYLLRILIICLIYILAFSPKLSILILFLFPLNIRLSCPYFWFLAVELCLQKLFLYKVIRLII